MRLTNHVLTAFAFAFVMLAASPAALGQETYSAGAGAAGGAPKAGVAEEVLRLEREYAEASKRGDAEALDRFHAEDFRMTARGRIFERAEMMARARDKSRPRDVIESLTESDVSVRDYGQAVVTTGRWKRVSKSPEGKDTSAEGHFTRVWVRGGSGYRLAVAHYSPVARPPAGQ
ncbi:MAG TPA: nuclear transport factor 2 family protein [Pyrinomonadaceae bacterium]|nr:nuclear transport factor 2 family protein [Pyrinomonadaceae bacterium]